MKGIELETLVDRAMQADASLISQWLSGMSYTRRREIIGSLGANIPHSSMPLESILEQFAVRILAACAEDIDLTAIELSNLLREPRKDALAGLITVVGGDG